jgi:hypothetical protein
VIRSIVCLGIFFCAPAVFAQQPVQRGVDQAERAEAQNQKNIPPPLNQRTTVDLAKLKQNADELAALAQTVPPEVDQTTKGVLPKDLSDKLKRIEKLAKQLRSQISQ